MAHRPREVLSKVERDALRELKADKDLVIVPADKGRSTVVLDRTDYLQKAKGLLEDRQFYVPCATNPVKALTREVNATLLTLENSGTITPTDRRMARPQDTALARFYGLPKVHKDGAPLRPIVSLKGTPTYGLAKWLFRRLKFLTAESDTTVSSSAQFLEKLKGDLAIETIELLLQSKYDETENRLGRTQVLQLLKFCLRTYFTFDGTIYKQVKGTPMRSPISGFIAEAVLQRLESLVFQHHKPKFWARYVDDTFVVIDRDQLLTFKERLNAVFPDIQFTMEEEENNQLAFLDVLVCRKDCGGLKTKVFRKATNTMQVLNFNSNHPISHKRSCVRTLYRRVETHCSEPEDKIAELQYLRRVFKANVCPRNFVNRCIRKRDERPNRTDTKVWRALPYVKNVSEAVGRLLAPLGVGVAHRPEATIRRQLMKPKDPLPRQETSGVVYRIWCSCGQSNYVGETGRQLRTRMAEHAAAMRRNDASSQVAAHSTGSGHTFKFDEAEILARGDNRVSRELLESWFTGPQSINGCNDLPIQYSVLRLRLGGEGEESASRAGPSTGKPAQLPPSSGNHQHFLRRPPTAGKVTGDADSALLQLRGSAKAFDTGNREVLWKITQKFGCLKQLPQMVLQLHDGMTARVTDNGTILKAFAVINGVKQGCVLAPTLFSLMFSAILMDAYRAERSEICVACRTDGRPTPQPPTDTLPVACIHKYRPSASLR
ncbi:hypothetical protein SprV_0401408600 [Sparganum proliferum]